MTSGCESWIKESYLIQLRMHHGGTYSAVSAFTATVFSCILSSASELGSPPTSDSCLQVHYGGQEGLTGTGLPAACATWPSALPRRPRVECHGPQLLGTRRRTYVKLTESAQWKREVSLQRAGVPLVPEPGPGPPPPARLSSRRPAHSAPSVRPSPPDFTASCSDETGPLPGIELT